jgi:aspartate aminotransferase
MNLSNRARLAPPSPIRKLVPLADQAKARGRKVFHLNIGQPDIPTPTVMWEALRAAKIDVLSYSPSGGIAEFVDALRRYYARHGLALEREELLVTTAGSEAILFALAAITDPGDEVIIPEPLYANYNGYAALLGIRVVPVTSRAEEGYALPGRATLEERIGPRTRALLLCNPCNPTGHIYTRAELETAAALARERNLFLIVDEVYREFCYAAEEPIPLLTLPDLRERAIMVDSLSKRFSVCGARIGNLASHNRELVAAVLKFAQARLSPPTLGQIMGAAALDLPADYYAGVIREYRRRRDVVIEELARIPEVLCRTPQGAFYVMARLPVADAEDFVRWMLTDFHVADETTMLAPGNGFYATPGAGASEVRIAYVLEEAKLRRAMQIIAAGLRAYQPSPAASAGRR